MLDKAKPRKETSQSKIDKQLRMGYKCIWILGVFWKIFSWNGKKLFFCGDMT